MFRNDEPRHHDRLGATVWALATGAVLALTAACNQADQSVAQMSDSPHPRAQADAGDPDAAAPRTERQFDAGTASTESKAVKELQDPEVVEALCKYGVLLSRSRRDAGASDCEAALEQCGEQAETIASQAGGGARGNAIPEDLSPLLGCPAEAEDLDNCLAAILNVAASSSENLDCESEAPTPSDQGTLLVAVACAPLLSQCPELFGPLLGL